MAEEKKEPADTKTAEVVSPSKAPTTREPYPPEEQGEVIEGAVNAFEGDFMEITVNVAKHLAEYEKALDMILNFIIRRCYSGDFVSHDKASTPLEERTVNIIGAAAERIARDLGIQESERTQPVKIMDEKHPGHYRYECVGKFTFRGRTVEAKGIATTLNPFYYKSEGSERKPESIREEYIVRDSWRDCTKQGIKGLFGLRKIPISKLRELGFDISKVKFVNFGEGKGSAAAKNPGATAKPEGTEVTENVTLLIDNLAFRTFKDQTITDVFDAEGVKYSWWRKGEADPEIAKLKEAIAAGRMVTIHYKMSQGKYRDIVSIDVQPAGVRP